MTLRLQVMDQAQSRPSCHCHIEPKQIGPLASFGLSERNFSLHSEMSTKGNGDKVT